MALFGAVVAIAGLAAWLGWTGTRRYARRYRVVAALCTTLVAPAVGLALLAQSRADDALARWDVPLHPAAIGARGIPGIGDDGGTSTFAVAAPVDSVRAFYLDTLPGRDWRLSILHPTMLVFGRGDRDLMILVHERGDGSSVLFSIEPAGAAAMPTDAQSP